MGFAEKIPVPEISKKNKDEDSVKKADNIISRIPTVEEKNLKKRHIERLVSDFKILSDEIENLNSEEKNKAKIELEKRVWNIVSLVRGDNKLWNKFDKELMGLLSADFIINKIPNIDREVTNARLLERLENGYKRSEDDMGYLAGEDRVRFRDEFIDRISNTHSLIKHNASPWTDVKKEMRRMRARVSRVN